MQAAVRPVQAIPEAVEMSRSRLPLLINWLVLLQLVVQPVLGLIPPPRIALAAPVGDTAADVSSLSPKPRVEIATQTAIVPLPAVQRTPASVVDGRPSVRHRNPTEQTYSSARDGYLAAGFWMPPAEGNASVAAVPEFQDPPCATSGDLVVAASEICEWQEGTSYNYSSVTVQNGGTITVFGVVEVNVSGNITVEDGGVISGDAHG